MQNKRNPLAGVRAGWASGPFGDAGHLAHRARQISHADHAVKAVLLLDGRTVAFEIWPGRQTLVAGRRTA